MPKTKDKTNSKETTADLLMTITRLRDKNVKLQQEIENHERAIESWKRRLEISNRQRDILGIQIAVCLPAIKKALALPWRLKGDKQAVQIAADRIESILRSRTE